MCVCHVPVVSDFTSSPSLKGLRMEKSDSGGVSWCMGVSSGSVSGAVVSGVVSGAAVSSVADVAVTVVSVSIATSVCTPTTGASYGRVAVVVTSICSLSELRFCSRVWLV